MTGFLPITKNDMDARGWHYLDFICVTGDAYVDHPTFGPAIISRVLEAEGFKVGIISQPAWRTIDDFKKLGRPRYAFLVSSGNIDSMVAHYSSAKKRRTTDYYSPGGKMGLRPDRAVSRYTKMLKTAYPDVPVIIGGLEASLRRFAHYDYWNDTVMRTILLDSEADLLVYGMGERQTVEISSRMKKGEKINALTDIRGTCFICGPEYVKQNLSNAVFCRPYEAVKTDKKAYAKSCRLQYDYQDPVTGKAVLQKHGSVYLCQNPPAAPLSEKELDRVYELPYMRYYHPVYEKAGGVPAIEEVEFSLVHNRGCYGGCNFCAISFHQGRCMTSRSADSVVREAEKLVKSPHFKGYIHDVGGPTANFRAPSCKKQLDSGLCTARKCLAPQPCPNLDVSHKEYLALLRRLRAIPGIKRVFIRSGLRYDYIMADRSDEFFKELVKYHISGQLKVAPEHCSDEVLDKMGKPHISTYLDFQKKFYELTKKAGREQYLLPYLMSSHPGSTLNDAIELALFMKRERIRPEQVQDFYPTPGTVSTCMYYTGLDPFTMESVYVARSPEEKHLQRALLQYYEPKNHVSVVEALKKAGRGDLIGFGPDFLVPPLNSKKGQENGGVHEAGRSGRQPMRTSGGKARYRQGAKDRWRKGKNAE